MTKIVFILVTIQTFLTNGIYCQTDDKIKMSIAYEYSTLFEEFWQKITSEFTVRKEKLDYKMSRNFNSEFELKIYNQNIISIQEMKQILLEEFEKMVVEAMKEKPNHTNTASPVEEPDSLIAALRKKFEGNKFERIELKFELGLHSLA